MNKPSANDFCKYVLFQMAEDHGKQDILFDDERTDEALGNVVRLLWREAKDLYAGGDREKAATLAEWLDAIAPNPNTGAFDGFWQTIRSLQPLDLGIKNPRYVRLDATM